MSQNLASSHDSDSAHDLLVSVQDFLNEELLGERV